MIYTIDRTDHNHFYSPLVFYFLGFVSKLFSLSEHLEIAESDVALRLICHQRHFPIYVPHAFTLQLLHKINWSKSANTSPLQPWTAYLKKRNAVVFV